MPKRVCVVGAGASGLPSIRHALLYGFDVVCYESQAEIGGLWRYKPEETDESSVMKSTVINSSKEMTAYSDFPPPAEAANFMHNTHMYAYLLAYAKHYGLEQYIQRETRVLNIERAADYASTGRWNVTVRNSAGAVSTSTFDAVLLCTGHHQTPHWPTEAWPGQKDFGGSIIHAHSYKDHRGYEDKTVVVVGVGNSGGDVAVELSRVAKQVYLVSRRGTWVLNRIASRGRPLDAIHNTRFNRILADILPSSLLEWKIHRQLTERFDHKLYGLAPQHSIMSAHPTVNDELPNRIACGTVRVKPQIASFTKSGVKFTDGTAVDNVDSVIVCTGYTFRFPVVENDALINVHNNEVDLYEYVFPQECEHDTLAIIGLIQPAGSIMPISEMQARVALDVLAGKTKLPSKAERKRSAQEKKEAMAARYVKSRRHTIQVDYIPYMDELASLIGATPPKWYEQLADPVLALNLLFAPHASYFYRLRGPHADVNTARAAIVGIEQRMVKATSSSASPSLCTTVAMGGGASLVGVFAAIFIIFALLLARF